MPGTKWSKFVFTLYSPVYDLVGNLFNKHRKVAINNLQLNPGDKVLLNGAGTGIDLKYLPPAIEIHLSDITPSMLNRAREKAKKCRLDPSFHLMDSMALDFPHEHFDAVVLHFIVAVVPDHTACLLEAERVLKHGGRISLMDKFLPKGQKESSLRKILNPVAKLFFSNISVDADKLIRKTSLQNVHDHSFFPGDNFRRILLQKPGKDISSKRT